MVVPPTPKRMMWKVRRLLGDDAKVFVLFLCGVQLVLRYGVLTVLDLDKWMSRRVLLRSLGRCCLGLVAVLVAFEPFEPSSIRTK
jgi:hypothetical protein